MSDESKEPNAQMNQMRFNTSQLIQIVVYVVMLSLAWANLSGKIDILVLKMDGVYSKTEIDKSLNDIRFDIKDNNRQIKRLNKHAGIIDE